MVMAPEDKNGVLLPRRVGRRLDPVPPPDLRPRSRHLALPLDGPQELAHPGARAGPPARAPGGTRLASAWDRRRWRPSTAGWSSTTACARRSPAASTARASRCSTSSARRGCCAARRSGCSARRRRLRGHAATYPTSSSPADSCTTRAPTWLSLYYGAADTRVALATANRSTVLEYLLDCPPG